MTLSMIRVSAHQVNFLPWQGFWHKLISSDVFILCAGFRYTARGYENRVRMADNGGWATIPVSDLNGPSKNVRIADPAAPAQLGRRIRHWSEMRRYRFRSRLDPIIDRLSTNQDTLLYRLNRDLIMLTLDALGHTGTRVILDAEERPAMTAAQKVVDIISTNGDIYLAGASTVRYLERAEIADIKTAYVHDLRPDVPPETVLHLIAELEDPAAALREVGSWKLWE
ncbi:MAG: WbqC family protein [Alphaproteobacteria bacterium]|nr:WbqC family protein [Alphaproteobacteria bacterium]